MRLLTISIPIDLSIAFGNWKLRAAGIPRRLAFGIHQDMAVRGLGGYSIMVLAK